RTSDSFESFCDSLSCLSLDTALSCVKGSATPGGRRPVQFPSCARPRGPREYPTPAIPVRAASAPKAPTPPPHYGKIAALSRARSSGTPPAPGPPVQSASAPPARFYTPGIPSSPQSRGSNQSHPVAPARPPPAPTISPAAYLIPHHSTLQSASLRHAT